MGGLTLTSPVRAQRPPTVPPVSIPSNHWVYPLLDRLAADGLLDGVWMSGRRPVGGDVIAAALDSAAARAGDRSIWAETVDAAREWLGDEYGNEDDGAFRFLPRAGGVWSSGPRTEADGVTIGARIQYAPFDNLGLWAEPAITFTAGGANLPVPDWGASWRAGPVRITGAYGTQRLGPGSSGSFLIHDAVRLPWFEVALERPLILPWILKYLGPFQTSGSVSRFAASPEGPTMGFFTGEYRIQPHPRVTLGMFRTTVIAGESDGIKLGFSDLWPIILGTRSGMRANFDDQKASMTGSVRLDVAGVRVVPYFEWAWEDTWEIDEDPGIILGVWLPALPIRGRPVGLRYEFTAIGDDARIIFWPWSNDWAWRNWYRRELNGRSVYSEGEQLLGHPLGGYGSEHRLELDMPFAASGFLVGLEMFTRDRIAGTMDNPGFGVPREVYYSNLLYEEMPGRSWGGKLRGRWSTGHLLIDGNILLEVGDAGWSRTVARLTATWLTL